MNNQDATEKTVKMMQVTNISKITIQLDKNAGLKKSNKYNYIQGKQLTDPGSGTRVYDIDNY
jgi:hypothetical protein